MADRVRPRCSTTDVSPRHVVVLASRIGATGGIERATEVLIGALAATGSRVSVLCLWGPVKESRWAVVETQARRMSREIGVAPRVDLLHAGSIRSARRLHRLLRQVQFCVRATLIRSPDTMYVVNHVSLASVARCASLVRRRPYVVWAHGMEVWGNLRCGDSFGLRSARQIWAGSTYTAGRVCADQMIAVDRVRRLRYAVTIPSPNISAVRAPSTVLCVSRLDPDDAYKGLDVLLAAWPSVVSRIPEARLKIVGDGPDRQRIKTLASIGSNATTVEVLGHVDDDRLAMLYHECSLFVLPSRLEDGVRPKGEGFCLVLVEAQAAGVPVIAGGEAGDRDAVVDGVTGVFVDPRSPTILSNTIVQRLHDPESLAEMGRAALVFAAGFSEHALVVRLSRLLDEVMPLRSLQRRTID